MKQEAAGGEQEKQLKVLRRDNFDLKMRIYLMDKKDGSPLSAEEQGEMHEANICLKQVQNYIS